MGHDGWVVSAGVLVTWTVLSWSGRHEFEPQSGRTWGAWHFYPKSYLKQNICSIKCQGTSTGNHLHGEFQARKASLFQMLYLLYKMCVFVISFLPKNSRKNILNKDGNITRQNMWSKTEGKTYTILFWHRKGRIQVTAVEPKTVTARAIANLLW